MYNIDSMITIINHLKSLSSIFSDRGSHYMMFCQYCNDSTRKVNPEHGHMYVAKNIPVFYCHRCDASGTILRLLLDTDFDDIEVINYIKSFVKYGSIKDIKRPKKKKSTQDPKAFIQNKTIEFQNKYFQHFEIFNQYVIERLGNINYLKYLIFPDIIQYMKNIKPMLACHFINYDLEFVSARFINSEIIRFKNNPKSFYYFQKMNFEKYKNIVICEGVFDIINIAIYNSNFNINDTFYIGINGKRYTSIIEELIINELLIGKFTINLIFDNDVNFQKFLFKTNKIADTFNNKILIKGWKPNMNNIKDVGTYPSITEV